MRDRLSYCILYYLIYSPTICTTWDHAENHDHLLRLARVVTDSELVTRGLSSVLSGPCTGNYHFCHEAFEKRSYHQILCGQTNVYRRIFEPCTPSFLVDPHHIHGNKLLSPWWHLCSSIRLWFVSLEMMTGNMAKLIQDVFGDCQWLWNWRTRVISRVDLGV